MERSSKKRRYLEPCHCSRCNGKERDLRTVQKHSLMAVPSSSSANVANNSGDCDPELADDHDSAGCGPSSIGGNDVCLTPFSSTGNYPMEEVQERQERSGLSSKVVEFILKELHVKLKYGSSRSEFEEHLQNVRGLINEKLPVHWVEIAKLLKTLGYNEPRWHKVCIKEDHSFLLKSTSETCAFCHAAWDDCIDYFVLGLCIDDWFTTHEKCESLMSHWEDHDSWLGKKIDDNPNISGSSKLWHGERFKSLSWFWDPQSTTLLPEKCSSCGTIVTAASIRHTINTIPIEKISMVCSACCSIFEFTPRYMQGDPRNQAVIIHEDGWAPHSTSSAHSVAAITISTACSTKLHRSAESSCRVYSFIPVHQLPVKNPHKYDVFFLSSN